MPTIVEEKTKMLTRFSMIDIECVASFRLPAADGITGFEFPVYNARDVACFVATGQSSGITRLCMSLPLP